MNSPLTVIVPVYNEQATVDRLLRRVVAAPYSSKQIVVVDDSSTDRTASILHNWRSTPGLVVLKHVINQGKGAAVRTALAHAIGEVTLIQDADLEYDPQDYFRVVEPILSGAFVVIYGSRYLALERLPWTKYRVAGVGINCLVRMLYGVRLTDEATCFKAAPTSLWRALALEANRFDLCPEVTAKFCRLGVPIHEVAVQYTPRSVSEGKKIGWSDVWPTIWTLFKWRFGSVRAMRAAMIEAIGTTAWSHVRCSK